jgi:hypothetical protein
LFKISYLYLLVCGLFVASPPFFLSLLFVYSLARSLAAVAVFWLLFFNFLKKLNLKSIFALVLFVYLSVIESKWGRETLPKNGNR